MKVKLLTIHLILNSTQICIHPSRIMKIGDNIMKNCIPASLGNILNIAKKPKPTITKLNYIRMYPTTKFVILMNLAAFVAVGLLKFV
jgi:hypothetical protein